jgi:hypothetical protein
MNIRKYGRWVPSVRFRPDAVGRTAADGETPAVEVRGLFKR